MSATSRRTDEIRVVGCRERLGGDAVIDVWRPPTKGEVEALPSLPEPPSRPRLSPAADKTVAARDSRSDGERESQQEEKSPPPPQRPPRPEWIEEGSARALAWDRPEDAGKLVRSMLMEGEGEEKGSAAKMQEVAILCVALGQEVSGEVMKFLGDGAIQEIARHVANVGDVSVEAQKEVLDRFQLHLEAGEWVRQGGVGFARGAVERACGPRKAQEFLDRVSGTASTGFFMFKNVTPGQVAPFISHEHPQTIALILSQLEVTLGAGILAQFPSRLQADVSYRIATMESVTPAVLKELEESLEASLRDILFGEHEVGGPKVVADILNLSGSSVEKNVLDQIDAQDPEISEAVRNLMFVFADITKLTDRDLQTLLREVSLDDLATSLKAASEELSQKFRGNMSEEAWTELCEKMEVMGPMRLSDVEEVQLRVVQQVRQLEEQGKVTIVRGESDDSFV